MKLARILGSYTVQPVFLLIHLTLECNCRCSNCYQKEDAFYRRNGSFMKKECFERILEQAERILIKPRLHFFGGEPLLHPDFAVFLALAGRKGFPVSLTTNGLLLERYLEQIAESRIDQINLSIDGVGQMHDKLRNHPGCFEKAMKGLRVFKKRAGRGKSANVNCVIMPQNHGRLIEIVKYFDRESNLIETLSFQHAYGPSAAGIDTEILGRQFDEIEKMKTDFEIFFSPRINRKDLPAFYRGRTEHFKTDCLTPWLGLNIMPDLKTTPGGGVLGCNRIIGDLGHQSMSQIWNGRPMRDFRRKIISFGPPPACFRCCQGQYY